MLICAIYVNYENENKWICFVFCLLIRNFDFRLNYSRSRIKKHKFILYSTLLFVILHRFWRNLWKEDVLPIYVALRDTQLLNI